MPYARRPGRLFASPWEPDGRQLSVYALKDQSVRRNGQAFAAWEVERRQGGAKSVLAHLFNDSHAKPCAAVHGVGSQTAPVSTHFPFAPRGSMVSGRQT